MSISLTAPEAPAKKREPRFTERTFAALATRRTHKSHTKASSSVWRTRGPVGAVTVRHVAPRVTTPTRAQILYGNI